jgi:hypothetical protein
MQNSFQQLVCVFYEGAAFVCFAVFLPFSLAFFRW